jgi:hypothetical protein
MAASTTRKPMGICLLSLGRRHITAMRCELLHDVSREQRLKCQPTSHWLALWISSPPSLTSRSPLSESAIPSNCSGAVAGLAAVGYRAHPRPAHGLLLRELVRSPPVYAKLRRTAMVQDIFKWRISPCRNPNHGVPCDRTPRARTIEWRYHHAKRSRFATRLISVTSRIRPPRWRTAAARPGGKRGQHVRPALKLENNSACRASHLQP